MQNLIDGAWQDWSFSNSKGALCVANAVLKLWSYIEFYIIVGFLKQVKVSANGNYGTTCELESAWFSDSGWWSIQISRTCSLNAGPRPVETLRIETVKFNAQAYYCRRHWSSNSVLRALTQPIAVGVCLNGLLRANRLTPPTKTMQHSTLATDRFRTRRWYIAPYHTGTLFFSLRLCKALNWNSGEMAV